MKFTPDEDNMKAKNNDKRNAVKSVFHRIPILIFRSTIIDTMTPIAEPMVYDMATPIMPKAGTRAKYRTVRGIFMARLIAKVCLYRP